LNTQPFSGDEPKQSHPQNSLFVILLVLAVLFQSVVNLITLSEVRSLRTILTQVNRTTDLSAGLPLGTSAPDFSLKNTEGNYISLSDYLGTRVLLMFSSPTCPYCVQLYPEIKRYNQEMKLNSVVFIMLSSGTPEENQQLKLEEGFTFEILSADRRQFADYRIPGTPYFVLIDLDGKILATAMANSAEELDQLVNHIK